MDSNKRYCQNRQRKRKRTIVPLPVENKSVSPAEEERQFKLRRFVDDVGQFFSDKNNCADQTVVSESKTLTKAQRTVTKVTIPKPTGKRGLLQRGMQMQSKLYTIGGVVTREMTARLDENLHQIISLTNNNQCDHRCPCGRPCERKVEQGTSLGSPRWGIQPRRSSVQEPSLSSPGYEDTLLSPSCHPGVGVEQSAAPSRGHSLDGGKSLSQLDRELYPLFTRVVSVSCTQTKSALFKDQSYVTAVKKKLVDIYITEMKGNRRELTSITEPPKATSSVGTSPLPSPTQTQFSHHRNEPTFKLAPAKMHFQSTMQFLEEAIGPSSLSSSKKTIPSPRCQQPPLQGYQPQLQHFQPYLQHRQLHQSLLSPPVIRYQRPQRVSYVPKAARYVHEPFPLSSPSITPLYNFKRVFDGGGDGVRFNIVNSFLPTIEEEEDSPDFRYWPRKIL